MAKLILLFPCDAETQATLTQMLGGPTGDDDEVTPAPINVGRDGAGDTRGAQEIPETRQGDSPVSHDNAASSWWDCTAPGAGQPARCVGSMTDLNRALVASQALKSTGAWAKASANLRQMREEKKCDALADVLDHTVNQSWKVAGVGSVESSDEGGDACEIGTVPAPALSPCAKGDAAAIQSAVVSDARRERAIEGMCPLWRDNVEFVQSQKCPEDVAAALQTVRKALTELEAMRGHIHDAFQDRCRALDSTETSLEESMRKSTTKEGCRRRMKRRRPSQ